MVFDGKGLGSYIRYRDSDDKKLPYIVIKCGSRIKRDDVTIRVLFDTSTKTGKEQLKTIKKSWKRARNIIECRNTTVEVEPELCKGCIKARRFDLESDCLDTWATCANKKERDGFVEENAIIISDCKNQERIFTALHDALHEKYGDEAPKIWCEGHLPIRSITVGPNQDSARVRESIEHYCKHKAYWLMDVEIRNSSIPYRS